MTRLERVILLAITYLDALLPTKNASESRHGKPTSSMVGHASQWYEADYHEFQRAYHRLGQSSAKSIAWHFARYYVYFDHTDHCNVRGRHDPRVRRRKADHGAQLVEGMMRGRVWVPASAAARVEREGRFWMPGSPPVDAPYLAVKPELRDIPPDPERRKEPDSAELVVGA